MIFNFIKHLVIALLLDAGAAMAFDIHANEPAPAASALAPQSCAVPAPQLTTFDSGTTP